MSHKVELLCKNKCSLGEGPHWDDSNQRLLFVDIEKSTVHRWDYSTQQLQDPLILEDPYLGAVVPREKGGLVVAAYNRFATLDETTGKTQTLAQVHPNNPQARFNDGKCDPKGRFWAGSMGLEDRPAHPIPTQGSLFTLNTDGTVETKLTGIEISNGLSWSLDNTVMYYIDSLTYNITAYKYDAETGTIRDPRVVVEFDKITDGTPDGHCIDCDGNLWVAMFFGGKIIKVDATTGQKVDNIAISKTALKTTSCCFGGPNMDELFVTSALNKELEAERGLPVGESGSLFRVTGLGVKGPPGMPYKG